MPLSITHHKTSDPDGMHAISDSKSGAVLLQSMQTYYQMNHGTQLVVTEDTNAADHLLSIEKLVDDLQSVTAPIFKLRRKKGEMVLEKDHPTLSQRVYQSVCCSDAILARHFPYHEFNPFVDLYLRHKKVLTHRLTAELLNRPDLMLDREALTPIAGQQGSKAPELPPLKHFMPEKFTQLGGLRAEIVCRALNDFAEGLRQESRSAHFKLHLRRFTYAASKNEASLQAYIDALFARYARLLVIRLDLTYTQAVSPNLAPDKAITFHQTRSHRNRFLRNMRSNHLFDHLVGYAWKLEYGLCKGFHHHWLLIFDGSKRMHDVWLGQQIGEYWIKIVKEHGLYWNSSAHKASYPRQGIGMIDHNDQVKRENLRIPIRYLTKTDLHLRLVAPSGERTFGKGEIGIQNATRSGRPRKALYEAVNQGASIMC